MSNMTTSDTRIRRSDITTGMIVPFVLLTFGVTWGITAVLLFAPQLVPAFLGPMEVTNPVYIAAVWAPGLVAIALVLTQTGFTGIRRYFGRLFHLNVPWQWWAFVLLALPAIKVIGAILNGAPFSEWLVLQPFGQVLGISLFMLFLGPFEEFGWRGFLLPLMQRVMTPALAGLIIGLLWAVWHIPAFFLDGAPHTAWSMAPFIIGVTSIGIIMAVAYNKTGGNLLFPILIHWQLNIAFWPEAQPWENYLNLALAVILLWVHRDVMFSRDKGLTQVVPD
jgi:membrane protease YdiL (CAAX protease family)